MTDAGHAQGGDASPRVLDAGDEHLPAILAIYNDVIATSTAVFSDQRVTLEERASWLEARRAQGYPVLVAVGAAGETIGFASFGDFRAWPGYRTTVEHSVHVRADRRGEGTGTALVSALVDRAASLGKHAMIAGVDADNIVSLRLHERLGFVRVAHLPEVARKFDCWLDLILLELLLT
jgi:phosphinothricin acetyltransferase